MLYLMQRDNALLISAILLGATAVSLIYKRRKEIIVGVEDIEQAVENVTASAIEYGNEIMSRLTRGERNNNPGNIVKSGVNWRGKVEGTDSRFETFSTPELGIRAITRLLKTYYARGLTTIRLMIETYAPPVENDTGAYVAYVSRVSGIPADQHLNLDQETLTKIVTAIIAFENGRVAYDQSMITDAVISA